VAFNLWLVHDFHQNIPVFHHNPTNGTSPGSSQYLSEVAGVAALLLVAELGCCGVLGDL
jgi:hypothetical protein